MEESASANRIEFLLLSIFAVMKTSTVMLIYWMLFRKLLITTNCRYCSSHMLKKSRLFIEVRKSVKKRMKQAKSDTTIQESDEKRNMFDLFM